MNGMITKVRMAVKSPYIYRTGCVFELRFEPVGESYYVKNNKVPIWVATIPYYFNEDRCGEGRNRIYNKRRNRASIEKNN